ncbi:MAG: hypothetical protein JWR18_621 [Segetibacter sp.]|jgi:hypothetical protein|nr:hypothetical protein [Segetibacter sp.]
MECFTVWADGTPGSAHLFSYHTKTAFRDLGNPEFRTLAPDCGRY